MMLRVSTTGLQDELRATMRSYQEEKAGLKANLASLRLDLSQLHRDDRTITTEDTTSYAPSHLSYVASSDADPELKRLVEVEDVEEPKTAKSGTDGPLHNFQLPMLKSSTKPPGMTASKSLRFSSHVNTDAGKTTTAESFLKDDWWGHSAGDPLGLGSAGAELSKEQQKFRELQKNQDILRNIGRAQLREKRMSLIRLPTITSAKKRGQTTWDSGQNVSRPAGKSTVFETHPYVEASQRIKKRNFKIPAIKDTHRCEIQLGPEVPKQPESLRKKRVQFIRPGETMNTNVSMATMNPNITVSSYGGGGMFSSRSSVSTFEAESEDNPHDESKMGGESLNTTLADTTMGDTSFDEAQIASLAMRASLDKGVVVGGSQISPRVNNPEKGNDGIGAATSANGGNTTKVKSLMKKNVMLHDLNTPGLGSLSVPTKGVNWDKASDMSVLTKVSRLSLETEEWKNSYMTVPDPDKRKKTLSDIMFAVRSRMRENEASLRFGETPRPSDEPFDFLMPDPLHQSSPRRAGKTPRKLVKVQKGRGGNNVKAPPRKRGPTGSDPQDGGKAAGAQIQGYLRRLYRHRRGIAARAGSGKRGSGRRAGNVSGRGGLSPAKPCSQEANSIVRRRHRDIANFTPVAQA